ncbi:hypothetical protein [Hymenobacter siberiensis]|uniref:hypothetical protein n=1 Tax=Hymenobacter siberiensis TaxID=2848396 RepID=UPI001C1E0C7E|nr:hypothetical protein [Hymenobacter siberiensis]MBU6122600.1 hypothetical protein [Hymenobacter siberiensis]
MCSPHQIQALEAGKATKLPASRVITQAELPSSSYTYFLYDECWLKDQATLPQLLEGLRVANIPDLGGFICHYYHTALAGRLPKTRYLIEQHVPFAAEFSEYLLANDRRARPRPTDWLDYLTRQIHEAQPEDIDFFFTEIATTLQHQLVVRTETSTYRITELEFYYHNRNHPDPYVHKGAEQLKHLHWYFNQATSLDLTFGDQDTASFGGILLRGLQLLNLDRTDVQPEVQEYISGPQLALRALVASWGSAVHGATYLGLDESPAPTVPIGAPWRTQRVGLNHLLGDDSESPYSSRPYRFIAGKGYLKQLDYKESICRQQAMDADTVRFILGYKPQWL